MGDFKEHGLMLFLSPQSYLGFIKFQADNKLGRSFAGQRIFIEGQYRLGYLPEADYEILKKRYSSSLAGLEQKPTFEQVKEKEKLSNLTKMFSMILDQWAIHPDMVWRKKWREEAEKWKEKVPNAKLVLALANGEESNNANSNTY
jgi:hypothetical protein